MGGLLVNQAPPFPIEQQYITEIDGVKMESDIEWMGPHYLITATGHPAISVPCAFTDDGLPVGLQLVGRHQGEFALPWVVHAFEQANGCRKGDRKSDGLLSWAVIPSEERNLNRHTWEAFKTPHRHDPRSHSHLIRQPSILFVKDFMGSCARQSAG